MPEVFGDEEIKAALGSLPGWERDGDALVRTVELADFPQAIQVVARVAEIAENDNHHPDIDIRWRTLTFRCSTHSDGGVTAKDVSLAGEINGVVEAYQSA
jgi:4a-hydroxytetrahydrobiopterin dehydratase